MVGGMPSFTNTRRRIIKNNYFLNSHYQRKKPTMPSGCHSVDTRNQLPRNLGRIAMVIVSIAFFFSHRVSTSYRDSTSLRARPF